MASPSEITAPVLATTENDREMAAANARVLWTLLGGGTGAKIRAKRMRIEQTAAGVVGTFRGDPHEISIAQLERHFAGEIALGLMCVANDRARYMAFDLDERGAERAHILADVLDEAGYGEAMIATGGSDADRAKVIVFFDRPQPAVAVNRLAFDLLQRARRDHDWGLEDLSGRKVCEIRPTLGDGGVLRIGGRHLVRGNRLERFFHPGTGEVAYLSRVHPAAIELEVAPEPILTSPPQAWVAKWAREGRSWTDRFSRKSGTPKVRADLMRLAYEAYRLSGAGGRDLYKSWVERIWAASSALHAPSPTNGDPRPAMGWDRRAADVWRTVVRIRARERGRATLHLPPPSRSEDVVWQQRLESFDVFLGKRGLNYVAFQVSYRELARFWGCDAKTAWRQVQDFVQAGALVIVDRGTQGSKGDKTIYAIPKHGVDEAYRLADEHHMVVARRAKRATYAELKARRDAELAAAQQPVSIEERRERRRKAATPMDDPEIVSQAQDAPEATESPIPANSEGSVDAGGVTYVMPTSGTAAVGPDASPETLLAIAQRLRDRRLG